MSNETALALVDPPTLLAVRAADGVARFVAIALYENSVSQFLLTTAVAPYVTSSIKAGLFLTISISIVIFGSFATISKPKNAVDPAEDNESVYFDVTDRDNSPYIITKILDLELTSVQIGLTYALIYPVIAGATLYFLYYAINNFGLETVLKVANWNFLVASFPVAYHNLYYILTWASRKAGFWLKLKGNSAWFFPRFRLTLSRDVDLLPAGEIELISCEKLLGYNDSRWFRRFVDFTTKNNDVVVIEPTEVSKSNQVFNYVYDLKFIILVPLSASFTYLFYITTFSNRANWLVANALGINFAVVGITQLKFASFKAAFILLLGLFVYDIYFVFFTPVMEAVATQLDLPIKIIIPSGTDGFSLLGLGDIVLPGSVVALCLRFDLHNFHSKQKIAFHHLQSYAKPYFWAAVGGYVIALAVTFVVLEVFRRGQPALLYIVPIMIVSILATAIIRRETEQLWNYTEKFIEFKEEPRTRKQMEAELAQDATDDDDGDFEGSDIDELYDEWEERVESQRVVYEFGESDDDTFVIGDSDVEEIDDVDSDEIGEIDDTEEDILDEIDVLVSDTKSEARAWYD